MAPLEVVTFFPPCLEAAGGCQRAAPPSTIWVQLHSGAFVGRLRSVVAGTCVAKRKKRIRTARLGVRAPGDAVGIQVPIGRIGAGRSHWQTIFDARDKPSIYRLYNGVPSDPEDPGNSMV